LPKSASREIFERRKHVHQVDNPSHRRRNPGCRLGLCGEGSRLPKIDLQKFCKETSSALATNLSTQGDVDSCTSDEQAARDQLVKDWATYPALTKTTCVQPNEYLPSYIEWLTCIEMTRDVLKMRKEAAASTPESPNGSDPAGRQCPIVKIGVDGSIKWVIAC
jgi:hypothetical protein